MFNNALSIGHIASIHNVADVVGLDLNLGQMAQLFDLHALGNGGGVINVGGKQWIYDDSSFLASLGAGGIGSDEALFFLNFDGLSGVMEYLPPPAPEPNSFVLLAGGMALAARRRKAARGQQ